MICGQGPAPAGATMAHYRDHLGLDLVPGTGLRACCVPGTFPTWIAMLQRYGTMRLRDVLEPALHYARNGYPIVHQIAERSAPSPIFSASTGRRRQPSTCPAARCQRPAPGSPTRTRRHLRAHPEGGRIRRRRSRGEAQPRAELPGARASSPRRLIGSPAKTR